MNIESYTPFSFECTPHIFTGSSESYNTVDIAAGRWSDGVTITEFDAVLDIGSDVNKFIVANLTTGDIEAQSAAPAVDDATKRLLVELTYETYTPASGEYPDNPPYDEEKVIKSWHQYQVGDIIPSGSSLPAPGLQYQVLQLDAGLLPVWDWVRAHA